MCNEYINPNHSCSNSNDYSCTTAQVGTCSKHSDLINRIIELEHHLIKENICPYCYKMIKWPPSMYEGYYTEDKMCQCIKE